MAFYNKTFLLSILFLFTVNSHAQSRVQNLSATQYKQSVLINFIITPGNDCVGYQIQRSTDSINFDVLYDYSGICGNQPEAQSIAFTDEVPVKNAVNYYRILIPPADYSKITSIVFSDISEKGYLLYSNPITNNFILLSNSNKGELTIFNQTGCLIKEYTPDENGLYKEDFSAFPNGLYYFIIQSAIGKDVSGKLIKQ